MGWVGAAGTGGSTASGSVGAVPMGRVPAAGTGGSTAGGSVDAAGFLGRHRAGLAAGEESLLLLTMPLLFVSL